MVMANLTTTLGSLTMKNPVTVASGTFGVGRDYADFVDLNRLGALTSKGVSAKPWAGNPGVRIAETPSGMLNSIGLQNPGVEAFCAEELPWVERLDVPFIVNVSGHTVEEYVQVIERLEREETVDAYEINISCPNVDAGGMTFGTDPHAAAAVIAACRKATKRDCYAKLTPNVTDVAEIARACVDAGADGISLINTVLGMAIDIRSRRPVLERGVGGLSGPAIKPIALAQVHAVYRAVEVPIIGMGGISCATDAIEFLLAGATAVAVGTANFIEPTATMTVIDGIEQWCDEEGVDNVRELIGALEE